MSQVNFVLFEYTTKFWTHNFVISCLCNISIGTDSTAIREAMTHLDLTIRNCIISHSTEYGSRLQGDLIHGLKLRCQRPYCSFCSTLECLLYPKGSSCFGPKMTGSGNCSHIVSCSLLEGGRERNHCPRKESKSFTLGWWSQLKSEVHSCISNCCQESSMWWFFETNYYPPLVPGIVSVSC